MRLDEYLCDPVFQLNLLLWMAKTQPEEYWRVRPVFHELGFELIYVEQPFPLPETLKNALPKTPDMPISLEPEPDLILGRFNDNKALYFEAKINSFGPESTDSKQAYGHLLAVGPAFSEVLKPLQSALLCYVLPEEKRPAMATCLSELASRLKEKHLGPGLYATHGLSIRDTDLVYSWDAASKDYLNDTRDDFVVMQDFSGDTDPSPLVLVFADQDCPDKEKAGFYRRVVVDQCHAVLLCMLHSNEVSLSCSIGLNDILKLTTQGTLDYLGRNRQKSLRRLVRENIFKPIDEAWKEKLPGGLILSSDTLKITWSSFKEKEEFLDWLEDRRGKFPDEKPEEPELPLFDSPNDQSTQPISTKDVTDGQEKQP